jgi:hypothetical protein
LLFWKNLKRANGKFPEQNPAYRCDLDTTHASAPVRPRDAAADASAVAATAAAAMAAAAAGAKGATAAAPRNGTAAGQRRVGGWVGKLAWQRWFALAELPFAAERRPWTSSALHRRPFQPVLNCDPVRQRERELRVGEIEIQPVGVTRVMVQIGNWFLRLAKFVHALSLYRIRTHEATACTRTTECTHLR